MTPASTISAMAAAVDRPIGEAVGLSNRAYTSRAFFRLERERIFAPSWTCLGHGADVPRPGDLRPTQLLGAPLLLARTGNGAVRVFHNVCSHRGHELVREACRVRGAIRCPYHAWTYDLEGRLTGTPNVGGPGRHDAEGFDRGRHGLREVRSAVWLDLVFVNLSGDAAPFETHAAPLAERLRRLGGDGYEARLHPAGNHGFLRFDVGANWKLAVENNLDASHLPWVHPSLSRQSPLADHYRFFGGDRFAGQGSCAYDTVEYPGRPLPRLDAWPDRTGEYPVLFPNAFVSGHGDHFWTLVLEPAAPGRTVERWRSYFVDGGAQAPEWEGARAAIRDRWERILGEDVSVVEGMQRGRKSPAFGGGVFAPVLDPPVHHFHRWVARRLAAPSPSSSVRVENPSVSVRERISTGRRTGG